MSKKNKQVYLIEFKIVHTHVTEVRADNLHEAKNIVLANPWHCEDAGKELTIGIGEVSEHDPIEYDEAAFAEVEGDLHQYYLKLPKESDDN